MMTPVVCAEVVDQNNWSSGDAVSFVLMTVTSVLTAAANIAVASRYKA